METDIRIDILLVEKALAMSRTHAQRLIQLKRVRYYSGADWKPVKKASQKFSFDTQFLVETDEADRFVSRGGVKLAGAIKHVNLCVDGMTALDVGQSTGGFTDCLLQHGIGKVVGVDVGHSQLAASLKNNPKIISLEGVNARQMPTCNLLAYCDHQGFDLIVMDVSFISQTKILPELPSLLKNGGSLLSLVKPQFEVGREGIGKGGLVRESGLYAVVKDSIVKSCEQSDLTVLDYFDSDITGGDGNREFFLHAVKQAC